MFLTICITITEMCVCAVSAILRSGRNKTKTKKVKKKNDFLEIGNQLPEDTSMV